MTEPTLMPLAKYSTLATKPSGSCASARSIRFVGTVKHSPGLGATRLTIGGVLLVMIMLQMPVHLQQFAFVGLERTRKKNSLVSSKVLFDTRKMRFVSVAPGGKQSRPPLPSKSGPDR